MEKYCIIALAKYKIMKNLMNKIRASLTASFFFIPVKSLQDISENKIPLNVEYNNKCKIYSTVLAKSNRNREPHSHG